LEKPQVFISYAHEDSSAVDSLRNSLVKAGYQTWIDREGIAGGEAWMDKVPVAIKDSRFFVLVISTSSIKSKWVEKELKFASKNELAILPVLLTSVKLPLTWDFILGDSNYIDISSNAAAGTKTLITSIKGKPATESVGPAIKPSFTPEISRNLIETASWSKGSSSFIRLPRSRYLTALSEGIQAREASVPNRLGTAIEKRTDSLSSAETPAYDCFSDRRFWIVAGITVLLAVGLAVLSGWAVSLIPDDFPLLPETGFFPWVALVIAGLVWGLAVVFRSALEEPLDYWDAVKNTLLYPAGLYDSDDGLSRAVLLSPPFNWAGSLGLAFIGSWLADLAFGWDRTVIFYIAFVLVFLVHLAWLILEDITVYAGIIVVVVCGWSGVLVDWLANSITPNLALQISTPTYQLPALVIAGLAWGLVYFAVEADYSYNWYDPLAKLVEPYVHLFSPVWFTGAMPVNLFFSWAFARGALEGVARFTTWSLDQDLWVLILFGVFSVTGMLAYRSLLEDL
jgi:hypothetical protein